MYGNRSKTKFLMHLKRSFKSIASVGGNASIFFYKKKKKPTASQNLLRKTFFVLLRNT